MFDAGLRPTFDEIIGEGGGSVMTGVSLGNGEMLTTPFWQKPAVFCEIIGAKAHHFPRGRG